jgi:tetratricopeptide (TPR) repeat protein
MTFRRPSLLPIAAVLAAFAAALVTFTALNGSAVSTPRAQVDAAPSKAGTYALEADRYLQKVRETENPVFYRGAERALAEGRRRDPRDAAVALGYGALAMSKHNFRDGLEWGLRAQRLAPDATRPLGLIADAQIELGRYADARRTLQRLVELKPGVPAYSRISYFRELHGDLPGAIEAMRLAVSAGGSRPSDAADVRALLGHLELANGRTAEAERIFRSVLMSRPTHAKSLDGLADAEMAKGRPRAALARWRKLSAAVPSPHFTTDVVELSLAFGLNDDARRAIERVRFLDRRLEAAGTNVASESAVFEADHGSPRKALVMARLAYAEAPAVQRADALGWALTRNGRPAEAIAYARAAMRLGAREPMFLYHGAIAAKDAGRTELARRWLTRLLAENPGFSPLYEPRAKRALRSLG